MVLILSFQYFCTIYTVNIISDDSYELFKYQLHDINLNSIIIYEHKILNFLTSL